MAFNKKGPASKGQKGGFYNRDKRNGQNNRNEQRRYADKNHFDANDPYSMMPPSRPPRKRKGFGGGNMEGVVSTNHKFGKKNTKGGFYGKSYGDEYTANGGERKEFFGKKADRKNPKGKPFKKSGQEKEFANKKASYDKKPFNRHEEKPQYKKPFEENIDKDFENNTQLNDGELIAGRNPVKEAIKAGRDLEKLMVQKGEMSGSANQILALAREAGVRVQTVDKIHLDKLAKNHQGMVAFASAYEYAEVEDILNKAKEKNEKPFIVMLDQITDPHNLGAIMRSAVCTGAHGVIIPRHRAVGLTNAAVKAAAGAVEYIPVARVTNLAQTIKELKKQGLWVYGMDMGGKPYAETDFTSGVVIVIGSEGSGISKNVREACDEVLSIPMTGEIGSFNASVAAGIIMHRVFITR